MTALAHLSDPLVWTAIAGFTAGGLLEWATGDRPLTRYVTAAAWVLFGAFWLSLVSYFALVHKSAVETVGAVVAVPASLYAAYRLLNGRRSLYVLSRAVAVMGLIYLPFETVVLLRRVLVEAVTGQTELLMTVLGYDPTVVTGADVGNATYEPFRNTFEFAPEDDAVVTYTIVLACTGIGSMATFGGLVAAVDAPLGRKLRALAVSVPVIYVLNLLRNVFIGLSFGHQYAHVFPETVMRLFGTDNPLLVSYFVADRIVAQSLAVVVLVGVTWLVLRELPEIAVVIEDLLYVVTGREVELETVVSRSVAAESGDSAD